MANPQKENGYTTIANEIIEVLAKSNFNGSERRILDVVFRKTWGWNKKEDQISLSQFSEMTGLNRKAVCRTINSLVSKLTLVVSKATLGNVNTYKINKNHDQWVVVSMVTPSVKTGQKVVSKIVQGSVKADTYKRNYTKETNTKEKSMSDFESFWKVYPKKEGKTPCKKKWLKLKPDAKLLETILCAIKNQTKSKEWNKQNMQYVPMPLTWLNQERWSDEITKPVDVYAEAKLLLIKRGLLPKEEL